VLLRKLDVFQRDPWLLNSTLAHELTHMVAAEACQPEVLPLALDEGLALQAEPPARRLMYRRLLDARPPDPVTLLAASELPDDVEGFYAECATLVSWLLNRLGQIQTADAEQPVGRLLAIFGSGKRDRWWRELGWESQADMQAAWREWYAARRDPYRMPLMVLAETQAAGSRTRD
jgi:hypothetical protein